MRTTQLRLLLLLSALCVWTAVGQQKLAQTGMKFLTVGTEARAVGLGEALTSVEGDASSMFFNPATMSRLATPVSVTLSDAKYIADINHYGGAVAFAPAGGDIGVFGVSLHFVDYGEFLGTIIDPSSPQGYQDTGPFHPSGLALGVSYARAINDKFSVGGTAKYVRQSLGIAVTAIDPSGTRVQSSNTADVMAFDFGILYKTGFKSLNFGMVVRNFSREVEFEKEPFQLPLTFKLGISMNVFDLSRLDPSEHALLVTFDAEHPRDFAETVRMGVEYRFAQMISLRVGYVSPQDETKWSYGVGLHKANILGTLGFGVDYAFTPFGLFGNVHRLSVEFAL
ncbi:MAG TPA: PorV/PorQ family protein [Bacteroidota bacterium]|nr:PorV/PorQ family protein [Bacteroidota bacterium]